MQYLGGKFGLAKAIGSILDDYLAVGTGHFVEPFVGGFNILPKLKNAASAVCSDIHPGLAHMYYAYLNGWGPPERVSEEMYKELKSNGANDPLSTFVSFACSFGGKEWGGYARSGDTNFAGVGSRSMLKAFRSLPCRPKFLRSSYSDLEIPPGSVVYCDPPYANTTGYKTGDFDHEGFYAWAEQASEHSFVFVSEFTGPDDWPVVWEKSRKITCTTAEYKTKVDKLFLVRKSH